MQGNNVKEIAEKWGITERQVQTLCKNGKIIGARKIGRDWYIPEMAQKPVDRRVKKINSNDIKFVLPMPKKSPFLDMTNLYHTPGKAKESAEMLSDNPEAKLLFEAEIAYSKGEIDKVYEHAKYFLKSHSGFYSTIAGGMLLSHCAMWTGDIHMWHEAKKHIMEAPCKNDLDRDIVLLSIAAVDSSIGNIADFPEWFAKGDFEYLPSDSIPAARVFYIKYLLVYAQELAKGKIKLEGIFGLGLMRMLPYLIEPMISQAKADKTVIVELYLRILVAIAYHNIGERKKSIKHIDKAIEIALPDKLLGVFAEHRRQLDSLIDERLELVSPNDLKELKKLHKTLSHGWHKLHNAVLENNLLTTFTIREREIARLAVFGLSDKQIAERLNIAVSSVKSVIMMAKNKAGVKKRSELSEYV